MKKIILTAAIAAALTLSCAPAEDEKEETNGNGGSGGNNSGGNSSGGTTETYTLTYSDDDEYFTYLMPLEWDYCEEGGVLKTEKDSYERDQYYSIDNKVMTWGDEFDIQYGGDTLLFKGSSNEIKGTWTRKKGSKATSCRYDEDNYYDPGMYCKYGYDITKAVFTDSKVTITREECPTDYEVDVEDYENGWKSKVVNCNTIEISKGSDKITIKRTKTSEEVSYKGKSCKWSEPTKAQKQSACKKAWNEYQDEDEYYSILRELNYAYNECLNNTLPEEFTGGDDYDFCDIYPELCEGEGSLQGKIAAKAAAKAKIEAKTKAKFKPLLKKKK